MGSLVPRSMNTRTSATGCRNDRASAAKLRYGGASHLREDRKTGQVGLFVAVAFNKLRFCGTLRPRQQMIRSRHVKGGWQ